MRSSDGLKVGVVGLGFFGPAHVEALRRLSIEVVGLFDSRPEQVAD
jgi:predicted dehydrogenase